MSGNGLVEHHKLNQTAHFKCWFAKLIQWKVISEVCKELLECETGVEMFVNKDDLPTVADVLLHFVHLQNSEDSSIRYGRIGREKDNRIYNATMRQLLEIWIENGFDEKLLGSYYSIRHRIKSISKSLHIKTCN